MKKDSILGRLITVQVLALLFFSTEANAVFFFFIPGSVISAVGDAISGSEGENCVSDKAKVGDILRPPSGNTATIKSLSGTSSRCQNPAMPVRALLEFNYSFNSKAGINLPDGFEPRQITNTQRFQGFLLSAHIPFKKVGIMVSSRKRDTVPDPAALAREIATNISNVIVDAKTANEEQLVINGMKAWRFEVTGKNKGIFGQTYTYLVTLLEGDEEFLTLNASAPVDSYEAEKDVLKKLSEGVSGLKVTATTSPMQTPLPEQGPSVVKAINDAAAGDAGSSGVATPVSAMPSAVVPVTPTNPVPSATPVSAAPSLSTTPTVTLPVGNASSQTENESVQSNSPANRLRELAKLFSDGIITKDEFDAKKKELLKSM